MFGKNLDTIAAVATAQGTGGIGIIRISGSNALAIGEQISKTKLKPRFAYYGDFYDIENHLLDSGIALYFKAPHSFTGEDCVELQGHGGQIILQMMLDSCLQLGARLAEPGEFSFRAFLNNKIDLIQAEAISDLISASSQNAAKNALHSLRGEFSNKINEINQQLIKLRVFLEATLDFPDEDIEFIELDSVKQQITIIITKLNAVLATANRGAIIQNGLRVVIAGEPNAGKSSLLNALAGYDAAIVTDIPGTTRDLIREQIYINGITINLIDTAGLRKTTDQIEQLGINRSRDVFHTSDHILVVIDSSRSYDLTSLKNNFPADVKLTLLFNKIDATGMQPKIEQHEQDTHIYISAKTSAGLDLLANHLTQNLHIDNESDFSARKRHITALQQTKIQLEQSLNQALIELIAEDLKLASQSLSSITGEFTTDDLLGEIFSTFCVGK